MTSRYVEVTYPNDWGHDSDAGHIDDDGYLFVSGNPNAFRATEMREEGCTLTPLLVVTPELEAAMLRLLKAAEFTMSIGVLATTDGQYGDGETISTVRQANETLRNALAGLREDKANGK